MVGRLVQKEYVSFFIHQLAKANLGLLPAAEYPDLTFNVLGGKSAFCKCGAHFVLGVGWKFGPDLINTGGFIVALYFLLKITDLKIIS